MTESITDGSNKSKQLTIYQIKFTMGIGQIIAASLELTVSIVLCHRGVRFSVCREKFVFACHGAIILIS